MKPNQIKKLRKKRKLNTAKFGALVGVSGRTVEDWEQGRSSPNPASLILLNQIKNAKITSS